MDFPVARPQKTRCLEWFQIRRSWDLSKESNLIRKNNKHGILVIVVVTTSVLIMVQILIFIMILAQSDVHYAFCAILACSGYVWPWRHVCSLPHVEVDGTQCYAVFCRFCVYARLNVSTPGRVEGRSC